MSGCILFPQCCTAPAGWYLQVRSQNQLSRSSQALYWTRIVYTVMYWCISSGCRCVPCIMQLAEMSCKISASLFNSWFLLSVEVSKGMGRVSSFQLYTVIIKLSLEQRWWCQGPTRHEVNTVHKFMFWRNGVLQGTIKWSDSLHSPVISATWQEARVCCIQWTGANQPFIYSQHYTDRITVVARACPSVLCCSRPC